MRQPDELLCAATALKRAIVHENALVRSPDHWIAATGTLVAFDGRHGRAALELLLDAIDIEDPLPVRTSVFGHYAVVVRRGDRLVAFCDEVASHDLFYRFDPGAPGSLFVSNFLSDFLLPEGPRPPMSDFDALRGAFHGDQGMADRSVLPGVRRIRGREVLSVTLTGHGLDVATLRAPRADVAPAASFDEAVDGYVEESDRVFGALAGFDRIGLNCTGGLDSRLLVAGAVRHGLRPTLLYGVGNSAMTNTRDEDRRAVAAIAGRYGWPLEVMDWRQDEPHTAEERARLHLIHGFEQPYSGTTGVLRAFDGGIRSQPELQLGAYNPGFTNEKPWERPQHDMSHDEVMAHFASEYLDVFRDERATGDYLDHLRPDVDALAEDLGVDLTSDRVPKDHFVRLLLQARRAESDFHVNAINQFSYYLAPFATSALDVRLLAVRPEWRAQDRFQLHAIDRQDRRALDVPIFSGLQHFALDRTSMTMARSRPLTARVRRRLRARGRQRAALRSQRFRTELEGALDGLLTDLRIDRAALARKDLRPLYRLVTALEMEGAHATAGGRRAGAIGDDPDLLREI